MPGKSKVPAKNRIKAIISRKAKEARKTLAKSMKAGMQFDLSREGLDNEGLPGSLAARDRAMWACPESYRSGDFFKGVPTLYDNLSRALAAAKGKSAPQRVK